MTAQDRLRELAFVMRTDPIGWPATRRLSERDLSAVLREAKAADALRAEVADLKRRVRLARALLLGAIRHGGALEAVNDVEPLLDLRRPLPRSKGGRR